ncbi:hypothetical protein [Rubellicoccus peritrichatus]|uniref:Uncharacterized protein n=1 Tax=Rubellicoccus peritrichatus TaxID=3080537 RepID=A0AAQ3LCI6_9BACT|nr:hypothetical protein [Puniceicoccus sp. CR14]WOO41365.1 hypothetical protein RZN69_22325 [Puniceicoccus sp. CR14]
MKLLFYSDQSVLDYLTSLPESERPALLVELASAPTLSFAAGLETPVNYPGLAGLCGELAVEALSVFSKKIAIPAILAPASTSAAAPQVWGLHLLLEHFDKSVIVLIHISEAEAFDSAWTMADEIGIAWDVATPLSAAVTSLVEKLKAEEYFSSGAWSGFTIYGDVSASAQSALEPLVSKYPSLVSIQSATA